MTIGELLDCDAAQLAAMTDQELLSHFNQYLIVTRPELAPKPTNPSGRATPVVSKIFVKKIDALASLGIDVSYLKNTRPSKRKY